MAPHTSHWSHCFRRGAGVLFLFLLSACAQRLPSDGIHTFTGETMGTSYTVKVVAPEMSPDRRKVVEKAIAEVLDRIDRSMSTWRADSDLSRFNASRETTPVRISEDLVRVLLCAREVSEASGGAFDVTVSPLVELWGFGKAPEPTRVPTDEEMAAAKARVGYDKLEIDATAGTLRKSVPDLEIDVGAIAPGYGSDEIGRALEKLGYRAYMVELGGEIRTAGVKPDGTPWNIAIERPLENARVVYRALPLSGDSLSTSGDYRDYYERDGVRYSHTIDPRTGRPIAHNLASVSVIQKECMWADAWATALDVLGPDEGYRLAEERRIPALFLLRKAPEIFEERVSSALQERLEPREAEPEQPKQIAAPGSPDGR